jgi:predicted DCC family thiol-disulfide oxidoreductase YuxK
MPVDLTRSCDPRPLALTRIVVGVAAVLIAVETHSILESIAAPGKLRLPVIAGADPPVDALTDPIFAAWAACAVALAFGFAARGAAAAVSVLAGLTLLVDQQAYSNHLLLLAVLTALLAAGRPSAVWSIDARRGRGAREVPYWPIFLIQIQIVTVYAFAALSKVNSSFLSGDVLEAFGRELAGTSLAAAGGGALIAASVVTIAAEATLAFALAYRRLRPAAFPLGALLHAGIVVMIVPSGPLFAFGFLCLATYPLFLDVGSRRLVVWDDSCSFCSRSVTLLERLDWFGAHEFVGASDPAALACAGISRAQADDALQLVTQDGRLEGYDAFGRILELCPLTFLVAPLLRLWPLPPIGRRVYRRVACRRACAVRPSAVAASRQ